MHKGILFKLVTLSRCYAGTDGAFWPSGIGGLGADLAAMGSQVEEASEGQRLVPQGLKTVPARSGIGATGSPSQGDGEWGSKFCSEPTDLVPSAWACVKSVRQRGDQGGKGPGAARRLPSRSIQGTQYGTPEQRAGGKRKRRWAARVPSLHELRHPGGAA